MMSQPSQLAQLPRELLDNVTKSLPTHDFNALRLTCKEIEAKTFPYWANCFFKKKQFMIDQFSLQTLINISQHAALSRVLTHLIIGLDELRAVDLRSSQLQSPAEYHRWRAANCAQKTLLLGGGAVHLLSQALANLPNLKTIDFRDFNSNTRFRDASPGNEFPSWRSYGSSRYQRWPRQGPWLFWSPSSQTHWHFPDTVFTVVLTAVIQSSTTLQNLEVILRNRQCCLGDDAFSIFAVPQTPNANDALRCLTKLHLDMGAADLSRLSSPVLQNYWVDPRTAYLRRFLALTPNLSWLRLNFIQGAMHGEMASKLIAWLALTPGLKAKADAPWGEANPAPVTLPLRRLDLGYLEIKPAILRRLLNKFVDLECISMRDVVLQSSTVNATSDHPDYLQEDTNGDCLWARFIREFHATNPRLKKVELRNIRQRGVSPGFDQIMFIHPDDPVQADIFTNTQIFDTTALQNLANITWRDVRWRRSQCSEVDTDDDLIDEDSMDDDSESGD